jgi:hypothetical protein
LPKNNRTNTGEFVLKFIETPIFGCLPFSQHFPFVYSSTKQVQYLADSNGFRVAANNLPVFYPGEQPKDTPEVEEAKRKHLDTWTAIAKQNKAQSKIAKPRSIHLLEKLN